MAFDQFVDRILDHEGGFVDHRHDPGGATNYGISQRSYPDIDIRNLTRRQAIETYRRDYWQAIQGDSLPPAVAFQAFDAAVNHGRGNAIRWLQRAAGVADDGIIGPITRTAVQSADPAAMIARFNAERLRFYARLSTFPTFGRGWTRRVADNLAHAAEDAR